MSMNFSVYAGPCVVAPASEFKDIVDFNYSVLDGDGLVLLGENFEKLLPGYYIFVPNSGSDSVDSYSFSEYSEEMYAVEPKLDQLNRFKQFYKDDIENIPQARVTWMVVPHYN